MAHRTQHSSPYWGILCYRHGVHSCNNFNRYRESTTRDLLILEAAWPSGAGFVSGGPGFKSSPLPLDEFVFGGPRFNSSLGL